MLKPLRDYVLIKPLERHDSKIIHVITKKKMHRGEVMAVGTGRYNYSSYGPKAEFTERPLDVKVGDIVNFGETSVKFETYQEDGIKYWLIQEGDIGFIEEANNDQNDFVPCGTLCQINN